MLPQVQRFAFGGIANPTQRATLRSSDREYLEARQREIDAFEAQRVAYNEALARYNQEVYDPYQAQVGAYNEALNKYRQEVYDPYQQQFDAYQRAVTEWNEGPRTEDYRGPAAPTLASQFELTAPVMPGAFDKTAPVLPFDEAKVVERQKAAAQTARRDAANRATAINVVSNPDQFGFGSLSIAERFMAEGGEVRADEDEAGVGEVGSAQALLAQLEAQAPRRAKKATPALKRMSARSDGASMPKGMGMEQESLGSVRELVAMAKDKGSARQQMEELARLYKLKITAAQDRSRGLSASTFGAPTLEGTTLTKNTLATKRFAEGGEVMDPEAALFEGRGDVPQESTDILKRAYQGAIPVHARTYLETVFGKKDDITEKDFTPKDLAEVEKLVQISQGKRNTRLQEREDRAQNLQRMLESVEKGKKEGVARLLKDPNWARTTALFSIQNPTEEEQDMRWNAYTSLLKNHQDLGLGESVLGVVGKDPKALQKYFDERYDRFVGDAEEVDRLSRTPDPGSGTVQYGDYPSDAGVDPVLKTLGRFSYSTLPDGRRVVTDNYDFYNEVRKKEVDAYEKMSPSRRALEVLKESTIGLSPINAIANAYIGRDGRPVRIEYDPAQVTPPVKRAKGSPEEGEAKGSQAEVSEPSLLGVTRYATQASARMFPDQAGQDDQRDAARHMLAAGTVARKYGPNAAKLLGLAHEYTSNPQTFFSALGIGEPRDDLPYDVHNNRIGAELAARATSQEDLERLVKAMALQAQTQRAEGKPYIMSQEQMDARAAKAAKGPTPRPQGYQEGGEVTDPEAALFAGREDVPAKPNMTGRELAQQALYGAGDLPYVMAGAPVDLAAMVMAPFGYKDDKPFMGSADIKARMTRAGIRPADTKEDRLKGPRVAAELLASLINPAAATRGAAMAVERGARGAGDAARKLEDATVGSVQRARIRSAADKVPPDTAYDPLRKRMEASGNLALAVRPDKIKDLMEVVRDQKGNYGARRVERAADEIPNLEELFEKDALREVFTGDNARALITLKPADFEQYALELTKNRKSDVEPSFSGVPDKYTTTTDQYVDYLSRLQGGFKEVPYLNLYKDEVGLPVKPEVKGHEGRHRNRALAERGERTSLVQISPRGDLREGLPRRTQEEYIEALKEELERSGRLVLPERQGPSFPFRPAIKLPDVYAKGGPVDKNTAFIKAHS